MNEPNSRRDPSLRRSIGTKLAIIFLALAILPMAGTAYYNVTQGQNEVVNVAEENLLVLSYSVATEIDQLLIENQRTSASLAGEPLVIQYMAASEEERQALEPQISQTLQNFAETHPDYDAPGLIDTHGTVVASTNPSLVGRDYKFRDYFEASVVKGESYISDISIGRRTDVPGVFLTNPVITEDREIVGMSIIRLMGESIWRITDDLTDERLREEEGFAYLVDQDGVIIAHPNDELLYHSLGELTPEAVEIVSSTIRFGVIEGTDRARIPESLGTDDLAAKLIAAQGSGSYRYYSPLDQRNHVVGYTRLETQPWVVAVDLPEARFLAPLARLGTVAVISVGVVGAVALIISMLLVRGITLPVRRLSDAAIAVEHDQPFEPSDIADVSAGHDEIAYLGRVFSNMVVALRRRMSELHTVYEIGQDITATLEVDETLQAILDRVDDVIACDAAEITLFDRQENALIVTAWSGADGYIDTRGQRYQLGKGFTGTIGQERRSLLVPDIQAEGDRKAVSDRLADDVPVRSLLGVPLLIRDHLVGTLELVSKRVGAFDENDQRLLETIAPQAAIAIEKAQQVREREQRLRAQIEQLRIEIDQAKRERQVSAITETEYFRDLARQAAKMRQRAKGEDR